MDLSQLLLTSALFFLIALAYSSVGMGGGSSYTALMAILGYGYLEIPALTLALNLIVTSMGATNFIRQGHLRARLILPVLALSIPFAYGGGAVPLPEEWFYWLLLVSLAVLLVLLLRQGGQEPKPAPVGLKLPMQLALGALLGWLAGALGNGGGVYLVPAILLLGLGHAKEAAAAGAVFIWVNSVTALTARLTHQPVDLLPYWPLALSVLVGGFIGSYWGAGKLPKVWMQRLMALILGTAVLFLARKLVWG
ncbi:MAG: TSUP family transporter [bacterium]|nr:TSUP family transporter [bacterium]